MFSLIDAFARDEFTVAFLRTCDEFTFVTSSLLTEKTCGFCGYPNPNQPFRGAVT